MHECRYGKIARGPRVDIGNLNVYTGARLLSVTLRLVMACFPARAVRGYHQRCLQQTHEHLLVAVGLDIRYSSALLLERNFIPDGVYVTACYVTECPRDRGNVSLQSVHHGGIKMNDITHCSSCTREVRRDH